MSTVSTPKLLFYQKLGELFYAIAASDKLVREAEYNVLTTLVEEEWKNIDDYKDQFDLDAAYQISIVFEWFDYEGMDADDCFDGFSEYYTAHINLFDAERKALILKTVQLIAASFAGFNKSELVMMAKLSQLFKK